MEAETIECFVFLPKQKNKKVAIVIPVMFDTIWILNFQIPDSLIYRFFNSLLTNSQLFTNLLTFCYFILTLLCPLAAATPDFCLWGSIKAIRNQFSL